jgi:hypothetical protein
MAATAVLEFVGIWHIYEMETWSKDYFNMEVQAYIEINKKNIGEFQFGLVSGYIDGEVVAYPEGNRFEFTWDGNDECDPANGSGWIRTKEADTLEGKFKIHCGDSSTFLAKRATHVKKDHE